jgi:uncharacterized MAPEG superfamily protein
MHGQTHFRESGVYDLCKCCCTDDFAVGRHRVDNCDSDAAIQRGLSRARRPQKDAGQSHAQSASVIGLLFVLTDPSLALAQWLFWGYVVTRLLHFVVYGTGQIHDIRATFWTIGSVIIIAMCVMVLKASFSLV